jgi:hypothetical protein
LRLKTFYLLVAQAFFQQLIILLSLAVVVELAQALVDMGLVALAVCYQE